MELTIKLENHTNKVTPTSAISLATKNKLHKNNKKKFVCLPNVNSNANFPNICNELRKNLQLCDGIIKCENNKEFKIHRIILAGVSPFFKNLFLYTYNRANRVYVKISEENFSLILDYAYTGHCEITSENVQGLLICADQYEVFGVLQKCCNYIAKNLEPRNCLNILLLAKWYFCKSLEEKSRKFILQHFKIIMKNCHVYVNFTVNELFEILADDELNAKHEELIFDAIKLWVEHNPEENKKFVSSLLPCVRFGFLSCTYYYNIVVKWKFILEDDACLKILQKATTYLKSLSSETCMPILDPDIKNVIRPRVPFEILFAIGGWSAGYPTNYIETYDSRADRWLLYTNTDETPRAYHGTCALNGLIYIIGGFDGNEHFNTTRSFNPVTHEWRNHACMYYARCYVSTVLLDGKIYAMGGFNGHTRMNSAERYDPEANQWELIASMNVKRSDACASVINNKIYIVGGFSGLEVLKSAEVYDPKLNKWYFISPMLEARSGISLAAYKKYLYVFGGYNGYMRLGTCERYDPIRAEWVRIEKMNNRRSNFACAVLENLIYVIGGFNGSNTMRKVEAYDPTRNEWVNVAPINIRRSALGACVLSGLPNANEYSYTDQQNI